MTAKYFNVTMYPKDAVILDESIGFTNIVSQYDGKWVYVQNKKRETWELPGGHREIGESTLECAKRELYEETWALQFEIEHVGYWSLETAAGKKIFGSIFFSQISKLGDIPEFEIGKIEFFETCPEQLTYPEIQPQVHELVRGYVFN